MQWYSELPGQRTRQIIGDLCAVIAAAILAIPGGMLAGVIGGFATVGSSVVDAGGGIEQSMTEIAATIERVPLVGTQLSTPFAELSGVGASLVEAGGAFQSAVLTASTLTGVVLILGPILLILALWFVPRLRWALRSSALRAVVRADGSLDLEAFVQQELRRAGVRR